MDLGDFTMDTFGARSSGWADRMNKNLIRATVLFNASVKAIVSAEPANPGLNDNYLLSTTNQIISWVKPGADAAPEWAYVRPKLFTLVYVQNEGRFYQLAEGGWTVALDPSAIPPTFQRELSLYAPGYIRPSSTVFLYVPAIEFTVPAGAPGSSAHLEVAAPQNIEFAVSGAYGGGTITFAAGSTSGVFNFPDGLSVFPLEAGVEGPFLMAHSMVIRAPQDTFDIQGLSITLLGQSGGA